MPAWVSHSTRQQQGSCQLLIARPLLPALQKTFEAGQPATLEAGGQTHTLLPSMVSIKRETKKVGVLAVRWLVAVVRACLAVLLL
jgi:hypothetical protein